MTVDRNKVQGTVAGRFDDLFHAVEANVSTETMGKTNGILRLHVASLAKMLQAEMGELI